MNWTRSALGLVKSLVLSAIFFIIIDFLLGSYLIAALQKKDIETKYRIHHPIYHHTLTPNFNGQGIWGKNKYTICTDSNGFKSSCNKKNVPNIKYNIAFIGDSFTEGIGLPYDDTFVGKIGNALPNTTIANLAVSTYAPSIYLVKVKNLIEAGLIFDEVVVYIDIGDIQDESVEYRVSNGIVKTYSMTDVADKSVLKKIKIHAINALPISYLAYNFIRDLKKINRNKVTNNYLDKDYSRASWTYDSQPNGYGLNGVEGGVAQSLNHMNELYRFLHERGIPLSIGIYPWPSQILHEKGKSRQETIWENFCKNKCRHLYNAFPAFREESKKLGGQSVVDQYFIKGDVHYNEEGNKIMSDVFLRQYKKSQPK